MATDEGFTHAEEVLADGEMLGSDPEPIKEEAEDSGKGGAGKDKLKVTLLISGAVVAVIGAVFAIAKKMKVATTQA